MINKFLTDIKIIKNAINTKKLVVFAGAGISIDAGVPSWGKLIDEIKKELDLPENETDYLKIPQIYYNERQEKEYIEKIRNVLGHKKLKHNEIHEEIFELNPEHILTTNFEDLLEQVINKNSLPFSIVKQDVDLPYSNNTKLLVKIHGDLESTNFVLKEDDYINYSKDHPLIEAFINSVFATKVVLFIGYSFNDYNLKLIVQNVRNILGNNFQNAYLLSIDNKIHQSHKQYLKNKGINVIDYFDADTFDDSEKKSNNYIEEFLKGKNIYNEIYFKKINSLSDKGMLLLNFIKFIRHYDELKIEISPSNIINQISNSLDRFAEIKSLPQDFISKLYPFKSLSEPEYLLQGTTLLLKNEAVKKLFMEDIEVEGETIKYNPKNELPATVVNDFEEKIKKIVTKLNNSLIFSVSQQNETADSFGYRGFSPNSKKIYLKSNEKCNCSKCKFEKFDVKSTLNDINSYVINEISDIQEDLQKGYLNYKLGNFLLAFNMYEEIASKSWQMGKYITYYIAKTNMKSLKWKIKSNEDINEEDKNKFDDIDTDKLVFQIPYKSNEEYELLKIIRDDSILLKSKTEINSLYKKICKTYEGYKGGYYTEIGAYYPQLVYIELYKLYTFYTKNYIIGDIFSNFKNVFEKGVEALIISHITSNDYGGRLKKLSSDVFYFAICYCDSKTLDEFLNKHKVTKLEFEEEAIIDIIDFCLNYFNSFFIKSKFAFNNHYKNDLIFNQLTKEFFKGEMESYFKKMMLLFLFIEIPEIKKTKFIDDLITFLEYENFIYGDDVKYLNLFLEKNYALFSLKDCERLLKIIHEKTRKYEMYNTINTIAFITTENKCELLTDKNYTLKILSDFDYYEPNKSIIVSLWKMSNEEIKKELQSILINKLETNFNSELYREASFNNTIDFNLFFETYIKEINNADLNYSFRNGKPKLNNFSFHNILIFIYEMNVRSNDKRLESFANTSEQIQFFLFRDKFDFSRFKIEWLYLIDWDLIYLELSKIKPLKKLIESALKEKYEEKLSIIYTKFFI